VLIPLWLMRLTEEVRSSRGVQGVAGSGGLAYSLEHLADVGRVEGGAVLGRENQPGVLPLVFGVGLLAGLDLQQGPECIYRQLRQAERAA
jgi:hypothetical protein